MRLAQFAQLPPDRHPLHPAPRCRQLLHGGLAVVLHEGCELLRVGNSCANGPADSRLWPAHRPWSLLGA